MVDFIKLRTGRLVNMIPAKQLQAIQKATSWTQTKLAVELEVSHATLNSWINQRSKPRASKVQKIIDLYNYTIGSDELIDQVNNHRKDALQNKFNIKQLLSEKIKLEKLILHVTFHTNSIEGSTMTMADVNAVVFNNKVLANRSRLEQQEALNHRAALEWTLDLLAAKEWTLSTELIQQTHLRLMNSILSDAGLFRRHSVRIASSKTITSNWQSIEPKLEKMISSSPKTENEETNAISAMSSTHAIFEQIHPFTDGNGRVGRLIMLGQAIKNNLYPPIVQRERKYAYYRYLEAAQTGNSPKNLENFIAESMLYSHNLLEG